MTNSLFERLVIPIASETDAAATAHALVDYLDGETTDVLAVNVVEKADGALDKASVDQRELDAAEAFEAFSSALGVEDVETEIRYGADVAAAIVEAANEHDATAIAFTPRGGGRWVKLLTGDVADALVEESDVPVVVLPDRPEDES